MRLAVLIDGDNAEASLVEQILNEAAKFGKVTIKRIYGDWTIPNMNSWKEQLNSYAIRPIQKFSYTRGKNSTDSALIIDAMDLMHAKLVDGFCLVSSDSDYTGIAHRLREEGMFVLGIGKSHTPIAFVKACENFTYTEILVPPVLAEEKPVVPQGIKKEERTSLRKHPAESPRQQKPVVPKVDFPKLTNRITNKPLNQRLIDDAFAMSVDEVTGMSLASRLHDALRKIDPTFDLRNYGFNSFRKFLEALRPRYEIVVHADNTTISIKKSE